MSLAAIVGIGDLPPSARPSESGTIPWMIDAAMTAMDDAGLEKNDIDGLLTYPPIGSGALFPEVLVECLGMEPTFVNTVDLGGSAPAGMVIRAAAAIEMGLCNAVLCVLGEAEDPRKFYDSSSPPAVQAAYEIPYGPAHGHSGYALVANRHMYEYGTTARQLAKIAVDERTNACASPQALFYGRPQTIDDVLNSRIICDPIHLLEVQRACSGAAAFIVTSSDRGRQHKSAVYALGGGEMVTHRLVTCAPSLTTSPIKDSAAKAFKMAGLTPKDIDLVCAYDCYTIAVLITLEDAGFCEKGQGGRFVEEHDLTYKGDFPLNTHGGNLSFGEPSAAAGAYHIIEAVRQLRGTAGERQVADCNFAFVNNNGGVLGSQTSLVLGREE
jgi:acetyl-CoA acetyltransferase